LDDSVENNGKIPLSWFKRSPINRQDWRLNLAELAAVVLPPTGLVERLKQTEESLCLVENIPLKPSEKYIELLIGDAKKNHQKRRTLLQTLHEAAKTKQSLHPFVDVLIQ
jgi:hypothetical protein